jgi:tyrosyl-DNA phosphodiesterase-1
MAARPECPFASACYRLNPHHFREYLHQHLAALLAAHPDLALPEGAPRPASLSLDRLRSQLSVYRDIEEGLRAKEKGSPRPDQMSKPSNLVSPKPGNPSTSKTEVSVTTHIAKSSNIDDLFDDAGDAELAEALRRSLDDQGGSSQGPQGRPGKRPRSASPGPRDAVKRHSASAHLSPVQRKLAAAQPYGFLLTKVEACPESHRDGYSVFLSDLLCPSLGCLAASLQINFMVELDFLTMCYEVHSLEKLPLVIVHGAESPELASLPPTSNIRAVRVKPKYPFGTHHTKLMVLTYSCGGLRIVVHTANLVGSDWTNRTQGLWVSA